MTPWHCVLSVIRFPSESWPERLRNCLWWTPSSTSRPRIRHRQHRQPSRRRTCSVESRRTPDPSARCSWCCLAQASKKCFIRPVDRWTESLDLWTVEVHLALCMSDRMVRRTQSSRPRFRRRAPNGQEVYLESHTCDRSAETTSALTSQPILRDPTAYGFHPFAGGRPFYDHFVRCALRFGRADGFVPAA